MLLVAGDNHAEIMKKILGWLAEVANSGDSLQPGVVLDITCEWSMISAEAGVCLTSLTIVLS
jgi:hypothetical protein